MHSGRELISYLECEEGYSDRTKVVLSNSDTARPENARHEWIRYSSYGCGTISPHHRIPVVVLTSCGEIELAKRAYALGARSFLTKPLGAKDFENMMH